MTYVVDIAFAGVPSPPSAVTIVLVVRMFALID